MHQAHALNVGETGEFYRTHALQIASSRAAHRVHLSHWNLLEYSDHAVSTSFLIPHHVLRARPLASIAAATFCG